MIHVLTMISGQIHIKQFPLDKWTQKQITRKIKRDDDS